MSEWGPIPPEHPRYRSLLVREKLIHHVGSGVVALAGLVAQGRGEAFDYLLGEETPDFAHDSIRAAAASLLLARHPVISVNGNVAALCPKELVDLAAAGGAVLEVNLFYRSPGREESIARILRDHGATRVLGVGEEASATIPELLSERRRVSPEGIFKADWVFVPLEDGDRTEALVRMGKTVVTVDLNPLSRTARRATITIVDNVIRALPLLIQAVEELRNRTTEALQALVKEYNNARHLALSLRYIQERLDRKAAQFEEGQLD